MSYIIVLLIGIIAGAISVFAALQTMHRNLKERQRQLDAQGERIREGNKRLKAAQQELNQRIESLKAEQSTFEARVIAYKELQDENAILKRDLQNIDVNLWKLQLDSERQRHRQETLDQKISELASRFLKDNIKWIGASLTSSNFINSKQRLQSVIEWCRGIGFDIPREEESTLLGHLKEEYERIVRAAFQREEQARIKAQIREEQRLEREVDRELKQLDRERTAIQAALAGR
jgi:hypothetical protein